MMITVRAVGRSFRFRPSARVNATLLFVLAYALSRFAVELHEFCWMSNHYHLVLTSRDAKLPRLIQLLNSLASRALNALRGWSGANFQPGYHISVETDADAVLEHCAYTLANPCEADLVNQAHQWGGLTSYPLSYGDKITIERPRFGLWSALRKHLMRSRGRASRAGRTTTPETVTLELVRPPVWPDKSDAEVRAEVLRRVAARERAADKKRSEDRRRALGMKRVRAQHWAAIPSKREDLFGPVPRAAGDRWARRAAEQRDREFERAYREARARWRSGERDVEFPFGTFLMREMFDVRCAGPP
jgi:REP element-mobilizing transposase RayT